MSNPIRGRKLFSISSTLCLLLRLMEKLTGLEAENFRDMLVGGLLSTLILATDLNQAIRTGQGKLKKISLHRIPPIFGMFCLPVFFLYTVRPMRRAIYFLPTFVLFLLTPFADLMAFLRFQFRCKALFKRPSTHQKPLPYFRWNQPRW